MTPKQARFVAEYMVDLNAAAAARRAGYSARRADQQGLENLRKPEIGAALTAAIAERSKRTQIDADWVIKRLSREADADLADLHDDAGNLLPMREWPMVFRQGLVVGFETETEFEGKGDEARMTRVRKIKLQDRSKTVEMIGRHVFVQAFRDQVGHGGPNGGPIPIAAITLTQIEFARIANEVAGKV